MLNRTKYLEFIFGYNGKEYYYIDILNAIRDVGIKNGDSIFVHSDLQSFGKLNRSITRNEFLEVYIDALKEAIGENGNLIMPTFSYSFCNNEDFDPDSTPSTVGIMTEHFRKMRNVRRSIDPIFSVAALGPDKNYFTDVGTECFGKQSVFEKLYNRDVKIIFLGETFDITYMHFVEQRFGVPYRFIKEFKGKIKIGQKMEWFTFKYYVVYLDKKVRYDLDEIAEYLNKCDVLKKVELGFSKIRSVGAYDACNVITNGLARDIHILLKALP